MDKDHLDKGYITVCYNIISAIQGADMCIKEIKTNVLSNGENHTILYDI